VLTVNTWDMCVLNKPAASSKCALGAAAGSFYCCKFSNLSDCQGVSEGVVMTAVVNCSCQLAVDVQVG
jgi:hypothetical protein